MTIPHELPPMMQQFWVNKRTLERTQIVSLPSPPLGLGQVRLAVDSFALTANNITYAAFGETMNYWGFYPTNNPAWGIVPVWGFGFVMESNCDAVRKGERFYGYFPMANEVVLTPGKIKPSGFVDIAAHREQLHSVYNQYHQTKLDPFHLPKDTDQSHAVEALLRPLFLTSWLIDDFLASENFFGANVAILSSASSKTAYGTAYCLKKRPNLEVVGLTSKANQAFCESLGCYDRVITYDELDFIVPDTACVYIDFAGNATLRMAVHTRFTQLAYSCSIGGTHVGDLGSGKGLPGPRPVLFFAPAQSAKRISDWGAAQFGQRIVNDWHGFVTHATSANPPWIEPQLHMGSVAVASVYTAVLAGHAHARHGYVVGF